MTDITITANDGGSFTGYLAKPAKTKAPGLLLIQEIFGVNKVMRGIADEFAKQGYLVLCPDLFWRQEPGIQITDQTEAEWQKAFSLYQGFDQQKGVGDLIASLETLRKHPDCSGKAGCVGYCLGGRLAFMTATRTDANASVGYYGVMIDTLLHEKYSIANPLMLHIAGADHFVPPPVRKAMHDGLDDHPKVVLHDYPGEDHGFAAEMGKRRSEDAARAADGRTEAFLAEHLG